MAIGKSGRAAWVALASSVSLIPFVALAQEATTETDAPLVQSEIIILGSVTTRDRTESVAPELVYDQSFFQRFEPLSVGDALKRVPGVSFSTDVGEFDDPGFRGLTNGFTQILINGRPIASAGGEDGTTRTVFVDRIPAELIDRIEIIRSPGADIDSQGVAGTINIVLKDGASLPEGGYLRGTGIRFFQNIDDNEGTFRGAGALGYSGRALADRLTYSVNANAQQRFNNKFSVQEVFDPENFLDVGDALGALAIAGADSVVGDGEERTVQSDTRENFDLSFSADLAYATEGGHRFALSGFYIRTERDEREDELVFEDAADNLVEIQAQDTAFDQNNFGVSGEADFRLGGDYIASFRAAVNRFDNEIVTTDFELDAEDIEGPLPTEVGFRQSFSVAAFAPEPDELEVFDIDDLDLQFDASIKGPLTGLASAFGLAGASFKAGYSVRLRDRDSALQVFGFDDGAPEFDDPEPSDLGGVFSLQENRFDGFILFDWQLTERLSLETGARFEVTSTDQFGFADGDPVDAQSNDFDANPSAHLRYRAFDWATLRLSYARTVRRPDFNERIPFEIEDQPDDLDTITGNPDLEFETANGVDAGLEFNLPGGGVIGINGFFRDISNIIQLVSLGPNGEVEDDDGDLIIGDAFTFANVGDAIAYGFEFDLSTPLTFLGLPNTGIFANYSLLRSEVDNAFVDLDQTPINQQPRFVYNVGATHDFKKAGVTLGFSYQQQGIETSTFLDEIQTTDFTANLEAFIEHRISKNIVVRLSGTNLLDARTFQTELNFDGPITAGDLDNFEIEREEAQRRIQLTIRAVF
ncbi:MAG TPA: hypothetical protein DCZ49_08155 [Hyphomonadaceae bacterium]|nr:hypothetical protein [Hyphomonadaceae bacterium]